MSTVPLSQVLIEGTLSGRPAAGTAGRLYFATDTKRHYYDNGSGWDDISTGVPTNVALAPSAGGNFTVAHGLGFTPSAVLISMTSSGSIWLQSPTSWDATNLYLVASDAGVTAKAVCLP
ncbi:MAG TPA: hypothetical protein VGT04_07020 [Acidobacteriaceae bacterium]|nr:hypothetical protein [Acidobacteriaceae bacterium]